MEFGSFFSGFGGLDLGLERAGMTCRWQVENDPYCTAVLNKHWPEVPRYGDIRELTGLELQPVELVAGGFPCQPTSNAGRRQAQADARWLWPEFARLLRALRPRYVLVENPPGLLARGFGLVLGDLAELGFDADWTGIPAAAVGASHLRQRIFLVAYAQRSGLEVFQQQSAWNELTASERGRDWRSWWATEPHVDRVAHGVPSRVERLRGLGNAVVPQVAEAVGRMILAHRLACEAS